MSTGSGRDIDSEAVLGEFEPEPAPIEGTQATLEGQGQVALVEAAASRASRADRLGAEQDGGGSALRADAPSFIPRQPALVGDRWDAAIYEVYNEEVFPAGRSLAERYVVDDRPDEPPGQRARDPAPFLRRFATAASGAAGAFDDEPAKLQGIRVAPAQPSGLGGRTMYVVPGRLLFAPADPRYTQDFYVVKGQLFTPRAADDRSGRAIDHGNAYFAMALYYSLLATCHRGEGEVNTYSETWQAASASHVAKCANLGNAYEKRGDGEAHFVRQDRLTGYPSESDTVLQCYDLPAREALLPVRGQYPAPGEKRDEAAEARYAALGGDSPVISWITIVGVRYSDHFDWRSDERGLKRAVEEMSLPVRLRWIPEKQAWVRFFSHGDEASGVFWSMEPRGCVSGWNAARDVILCGRVALHVYDTVASFEVYELQLQKTAIDADGRAEAFVELFGTTAMRKNRFAYLGRGERAKGEVVLRVNGLTVKSTDPVVQQALDHGWVALPRAVAPPLGGTCAEGMWTFTDVDDYPTMYVGAGGIPVEFPEPYAPERFGGIETNDVTPYMRAYVDNMVWQMTGGGVRGEDGEVSEGLVSGSTLCAWLAEIANTAGVATSGEAGELRRVTSDDFVRSLWMSSLDNVDSTSAGDSSGIGRFTRSGMTALMSHKVPDFIYSWSMHESVVYRKRYDTRGAEDTHFERDVFEPLQKAVEACGQAGVAPGAIIRYPRSLPRTSDTLYRASPDDWTSYPYKVAAVDPRLCTFAKHGNLRWNNSEDFIDSMIDAGFGRTSVKGTWYGPSLSAFFSLPDSGGRQRVAFSNGGMLSDIVRGLKADYTDDH